MRLILALNDLALAPLLATVDIAVYVPSERIVGWGFAQPSSLFEARQYLLGVLIYDVLWSVVT